ncbi:uncharacterized protein LOC125767949 isoform X2 [Anopheles funestus]|uniref:uncharacterized protein LOC125767949 isoform X2 n=1 Tax=Anopheles funestus TaxID=62324 RepID=UPI0020C64512|nr:uncharacterized protein LOC125767949 isoform X2 [Anopheles funestus]
MSSAAPVTVKQERHDEAEIKEMAAKIVEAHKQQSAKAAAAAVQQQQVPARPAAVNATVTANGVTPGQTNILNYLTRKPTNATGVNATGAANVMAGTAGGATTVALPLGSGQSVASNGSGKAYDGGGSDVNGSGEKKANDEESQKGHFGWEVFPAKVYIPFILRQQERYCAVRMVEMKLLNKYLNYLHQDIYTCTCVRSYYITDAECKLLNEINQKHSDMQFGRELFTLKDLVVRVSDAYKFYQFLEVCYKKLLMGCSTPNDKCGFIRINKESVVPYTVRDYQKMVPLFYFEGETDNLKLKADNLSGWDLSYLKFCCKVQGIRNELFASDSVAVISLTDIKGYFPPGTEFEDYWPSKVVDSQLLSGPKSNTVHWTRQPAQPPPKTPAMMNSAPARKGTSNVYQTLQTQQNLAKTNNQMNSITAAALTNNWNMVPSNHPNLLSAQQEQLLRLSQAQQAAQAQAQIRNIQNMHSMQQYNSSLYNAAMSLTSRSSQNQQVPPPLVRSAQVQAHLSSGGSGASSVPRSSTNSGSSGNGNTLPNLNPALSIFATTSSPNGTVNLSRLNQQQISELTMASASGMANPGGGNNSRSATAKTGTNRNAASTAAAIASFTAAMTCGRQNTTSNLDGFSLGRNVTITPAAKRSASTLEEFAVRTNVAASLAAGYGGVGANGRLQSVAYPKNPISITAVPVGSPTRASPKGGQARQPPPALIPVGSGNELMDNYVTNGVDLLAHLRLSKDIEIINERMLETTNRSGDSNHRHGKSGNSGKHLPSYRESTTNSSSATGSEVVPQSVIVHDRSRPNSSSSSSRVEYTRNQSVITSAGGRQVAGAGGDSEFGGIGTGVSDGRSPYLNALIAAGLSDVIDLSSTQRSSMAGAQHLVQQAAAAAVAQQQQQQQQQQSQSGRRSAASSSVSIGGRSVSISSTGGSGNGASAGANSYRNSSVAAIQQQLQQQAQQQQQQQAQQQQVQHQQHAAATAAAAAAINSLAAETRHGNMIVLPEMNVGVTQYKPYEVVKKPVENKIIYCVNKTPYRNTEYLMTIFDLKDVFFPYISLDVCRRVLSALDISLFVGNSLQYQALQEAGRTNVDKMPMIQVTDVMTYMPQLQYMIRSSNMNQETQANKRARIS